MSKTIYFSKPIILVGIMGAGKSHIGRDLAHRLDVPFTDADREIERAAGMDISDIFQTYGESAFRDVERKVLQRLIYDGGMQVIATGGGALVTEETRDLIAKHGFSVWLNAEVDVLMERVKRTDRRPLLQTDDPKSVMEDLIEQRRPYYEAANLTVQTDSRETKRVVKSIVSAMKKMGALSITND